MDNGELQEILLAAFVQEAPDLLQQAQSALIDLEQANASDKALYSDALKRALHSLKGASSAIGNESIRDVCHALEELLSCHKKHLAEPALERLHEGLSFLRIAAESAGQNIDASDLLAYINDISVSVEPMAEPVVATMAMDESLGLAEAKPLKHSDTIRVTTQKIDAVQANVGELVSMHLQQDNALFDRIKANEDINQLQQTWQQLRSIIYDMRSHLPISLFNKADRKMADLSQQMKLVQKQNYQQLNRNRKQVAQFNILVEEMDLSLRSIRMMPLGPFLSSFKTVVYDASKQLNKKVKLETTQEEIELDRLVVEKLKEPLLHLIRNSVAHGIETPEQREKQGKNAEGSIKLLAHANGDFVRIEVIDDGAGFDEQAIYQKALKQGLIHTGEVLDSQKLLQLVSLPGFSTSEKANLVAGRGVGMDVISMGLAELGGSIELKTQQGAGCRFILNVPSSLATSKGLIVQVGNHLFGIALDSVERIIRSPLEKIQIVEGQAVFYIDHEAVSLISLAKLLQLHEAEPRDETWVYPIICLKLGNRRLALVVDDIPGETPLIMKTMGPQFEHIAVYAGATILPSGQVLALLNVRQLMQMAQQANNGEVISQLKPIGEDQAGMVQANARILVVDDSITTRTLERNILESAGYHVLVATDGVEALEILTYEEDIVLLITDLEMPRMNGFELCQAVRSSKRAYLPIIMVTSIGSEHEKRQGITVGADAYIVKSEFQQGYFLEMVRRFAY